MSREIFYNPLAYQDQFHESRKPKVYLSAGYGAGKTYSLCMKMFYLMALNRGLAGGLLAPTLKMFKRDVLPTIREICEDNGIPYKYHKTDSYFYFPDTKSTVYVFHGEDDGQSIRGPNLAFMLINEVTLISKATFDAAIARVRVKTAGLLQVAMSGTPEGFNWAYDYFVEAQRNDTDLIFGDMRLNTHINDAYAQTLIDSYDKLLAEQYVQGKFVNLVGNRAVYSFDRHRHTAADIEKIPYAPVWVSMDFNVNPMSGVLWNRMPLGSGVLLRAFDEISIDGSNTDEFCEVLKTKISPDDDVTIYPDPAGQAGSTKSKGKSDIDILKQHGFTDIKMKSRIISVRDCLNSLNRLFDRNHIVVNTKKCKSFISDLEQCIIKPGSHEIDKRDPRRSHWLDGAKNMADYEFPVRKPSTGLREQRIR